MSQGQPTDDARGDASATPKRGRIRQMLLPLAMRHGPLRQGIGIHVIYRNTGGGLIVGGLSYAALFALIPTFVLVIAGIFLLIDDPQLRADAVELINTAFPVMESFTGTAVERATEIATVGGVVALVGFAWGASGLYLNLVRAMERFFPGQRVSGVLARILGVLLVVLIIVGVLVAVFVAGVVTVVLRALELDAEWILTLAGAVLTLVGASALVYGVYRVMPANPPLARSARLPALLVGAAIAAMTLLYGLISPWLVSGFQVFGVVASVFVALIWLRVVFLAMVYGAAMARYRDYVAAGRHLGLQEPDRSATEHAMAEEDERAMRETRSIEEIERRRAAAEDRPGDRDDADPGGR